MHSLFRGSRRGLVAGLCSGDEMTDRKKWCWFVYACSHPALLDFLHRPFASLHSPRTGARRLTSIFLLVATDSSTGMQLLQPLLPSKLEKLHGVKHDGGSRRLISEP